jgi:thiosulfate/3-mercaptopyruvate sulfurtransferase
MADLLTEKGDIPAEDVYYLLGGEHKDKIKILDATFGTVRGLSAYQAFLGARIENAQFFDIDVVADQEAPLPHTLPTPEYFAQCVSAMGISNGDHVVIYDQSGAYTASARAWWMFRAFGHDKVYVLDGGLGAWKARGFPIASGPAKAPAPGSFEAEYPSGLVVSRNDIIDNLETGKFLVLDARPAVRFTGLSPEPRPGMRAGHIPKSINLPFAEMLETSSLFKSDKALEHLFGARKLSPEAKLAVSCGSGVTACVVALALFKARGQEAAIYDGSWSEWGDKNSNTPIEVSA